MAKKTATPAPGCARYGRRNESDEYMPAKKAAWKASTLSAAIARSESISGKRSARTFIRLRPDAPPGQLPRPRRADRRVRARAAPGLRLRPGPAHEGDRRLVPLP